MTDTDNMKTPVAVTLIIMGAVVVITPAISDFLFQHNLVAILSKPGITSANLDGKMGDLYRIACWLTGSAMVATAILGSLVSRKERTNQTDFAAQVA
jgi:hypothetical protein